MNSWYTLNNGWRGQGRLLSLTVSKTKCIKKGKYTQLNSDFKN